MTAHVPAPISLVEHVLPRSTRAVRATAAILTLASVLMSMAGSASATPLDRVDDREQRLEAWLEDAARDEAAEATLFGSLDLAAGVLAAGAGAWELFADDTDDRWFGGALLAYAPLRLGEGIATLVRPRTAAARLARWRARGTHGPLDLACFEAELRAEADLSRSLRVTGAIENYSLAAAGGIVAAVVASSSASQRIRWSTIAWGGGLATAGLLFGTLGLASESEAEHRLRSYRRGLAPAAHAVPSRPTARNLYLGL